MKLLAARSFSVFLYSCISVFCIPVSTWCLAEEHKREKWDLLCFGTHSYGKGSENPKRLGLLLSFNIDLCLVVQECLWFWLGIPFCLPSPDAFFSPGVPVSTHLTGECSVGQGNCQLCGQHCTELIISEELHHEKICKAHSHHKNLPWVLNWVYGRDHTLFISMPNATEPGLSETTCKPEKSMSWVVSLLALISPSPGIMWKVCHLLSGAAAAFEWLLCWLLKRGTELPVTWKTSIPAVHLMLLTSLCIKSREVWDVFRQW